MPATSRAFFATGPVTVWPVVYVTVRAFFLTRPGRPAPTLALFSKLWLNDADIVRIRCWSIENQLPEHFVTVDIAFAFAAGSMKAGFQSYSKQYVPLLELTNQNAKANSKPVASWRLVFSEPRVWLAVLFVEMWTILACALFAVPKLCLPLHQHLTTFQTQDPTNRSCSYSLTAPLTICTGNSCKQVPPNKFFRQTLSDIFLHLGRASARVPALKTGARKHDYHFFEKSFWNYLKIFFLWHFSDCLHTVHELGFYLALWRYQKGQSGAGLRKLSCIKISW